jgi:hypothetical protein
MSTDFAQHSPANCWSRRDWQGIESDHGKALRATSGRRRGPALPLQAKGIQDDSVQPDDETHEIAHDLVEIFDTNKPSIDTTLTGAVEECLNAGQGWVVPAMQPEQPGRKRDSVGPTHIITCP